MYKMYKNFDWKLKQQKRKMKIKNKTENQNSNQKSICWRYKYMKIKQVSIFFLSLVKKCNFFLTKQQTKFCTRKYNMKLNFQVLCVFYFFLK